jgi:hypothetical protein
MSNGRSRIGRSNGADRQKGDGLGLIHLSLQMRPDSLYVNYQDGSTVIVPP